MNPKVSVIIPCRNEQATIAGVLGAISIQTFPIDQLEVIIADGCSSDGTRETIDQYSQENPAPAIKVIENSKQTIPAALNSAIRISKGNIILRLDAHAFPSPNYIKTSVEILENGKGDIVGGVWQIKPGSSTWIAQSIAHAAANRLGVGDALYRYTQKAGSVDTVPFGAFYKNLVDKIGNFDESLLTNEDYEFNARIRKMGGIVWLDPKIKSEYIARSNLRELARQYWRYGYWKNRMLRRYPGTLKLRQALPPIFVLTVFLLILLSFGSEYAQLILALEVGLYLFALIIASVPAVIDNKDMKLLIGIPLAIATMHFSWGLGFLSGFVSPVKSTRKQ